MGNTDWINLVHNRERWKFLMNAVMNLRVPQNARNFLIAEDMLASQEGLCSMELVSYHEINAIRRFFHVTFFYFLNQNVNRLYQKLVYKFRVFTN